MKNLSPLLYEVACTPSDILTVKYCRGEGGRGRPGRSRASKHGRAARGSKCNPGHCCVQPGLCLHAPRQIGRSALVQKSLRPGVKGLSLLPVQEGNFASPPVPRITPHHAVDLPQDLVNLANLGLVFQEDGGVEVRDLRRRRACRFRTEHVAAKPCKRWQKRAGASFDQHMLHQQGAASIPCEERSQQIQSLEIASLTNPSAAAGRCDP